MWWTAPTNGIRSDVPGWCGYRRQPGVPPTRDKITIIGIDMAKRIFQRHAIGRGGTAVLGRQLRRDQVLGICAKRGPCLIGLAAGATLHDWARKWKMLGHDVRLIPPIHVKPHGKRQKNDAADAEIICEAVQRPAMRFVTVNSARQQGVLMLRPANFWLTNAPP
jgi:transposase